MRMYKRSQIADMVGLTGSLTKIVSRPAIQATGGIITKSGLYTYHTFKSSGSFIALYPLMADILIVGGGGSGGAVPSYSWGYASGGGGAGAMLEQFGRSLAVATFPIVVGNGGSMVYGSSGGNGYNGGNSSFDTAVALGGGGGGAGSSGLNGGCGGGGGVDSQATNKNGGGSIQTAVSGFSIYGTSGGYAGGGGGAGGAGVHGTGTNSGAGASRISSITGNVYCAGGRSELTVGYSQPQANSGNGGDSAGDVGRDSKAGCSGVVVIRYLT